MKRLEVAVITVMMVLLIVGGCAMGRKTAPSADLDRPVVSLPTIAPTQAIIVPTPPAGSVTFYGDGNSYTYNITVNETNTDMCAAVVGCW